jgi:hypothetical protein
VRVTASVVSSKLRIKLRLLDQVALDCALKQESAFTELGLTPKNNRLIACFSPLQTKACCAAEKVDATTLPHPWIGSEKGSADSHEDHRTYHFLDHSHPSCDDEILARHTAPLVASAISYGIEQRKLLANGLSEVMKRYEYDGPEVD